MLQAGSRLGPYEILERLPSGAYRAYDYRHAREATLQILRVGLNAEPERPSAPDAASAGPPPPAVLPTLETYDFAADVQAVYVVTPTDQDTTSETPIEARAVPLVAAAHWAGQVGRSLAGRSARAVRRPNPLRRRAASTVALVVSAVAMLILAIQPTAPVEPNAPATAGGDAPAGSPDLAPLVPLVISPVPMEAPAAPAPATPGTTVARLAATTRPAPSEQLPRAPLKPGAAVSESGRQPLAALPAMPSSVRPLTPVAADGRDVGSLMTEASVRATEFDLAGAYELSRAAASRGDAAAQIAAPYIRGLIDARDAFRDGGPPGALAPVREAIGSLQGIAKGRPGAAEIARLTLQAAAAAAQSERDEMSLYLETALEMESLQRMAGLPGAPLVSAAEVAGDLWLQVHRYEDARRAYTQAADRGGSTLRVLSGLARAARRLNDAASACASYRRLLDAWGGRPGLPVEVAEARAYIGGCAQ